MKKRPYNKDVIIHESSNCFEEMTKWGNSEFQWLDTSKEKGFLEKALRSFLHVQWFGGILSG